MLRSASLSVLCTAALLAASTLALSPPDVPTVDPETQACDDTWKEHQAPGGAAGAQGATEADARHKGALAAGWAVRGLITPCDTCPDGEVCNTGWQYDWPDEEDGFVQKTTWDANLEVWMSTVEWTGCSVLQRCGGC